jgi:hypothetical protein
MVKTGFNGSIVPIGNHEGYNCQGGGRGKSYIINSENIERREIEEQFRPWKTGRL